ncbi:MAG: hypothetical protein JST26_04835 [Bacteroidetes bacterium]|nr:hypothetical protein [Bacteroidota bacterium]
MLTLISKEAIDKSGFSVDNLKSWGLASVTTVGGMIAAHVALKAIKKQDSLLVNVGAFGAGVAGAMFIKNPWVKLLSLGVAGYSLLRLGNIAVKEVAAPGDTGAAGLSGLIPENLKSKIRNFLPSLGSAETLLGEDDLNGMPNLDDVAGTEDIGYTDVTNLNSIGSTML